MKRINLNRKFNYFFIYLIVSIAFIMAVWFEKEMKITQHLEEKTANVMLNYNSLYHEHKILANVIFQTKINTDKILNIFEKASIQDSSIQNNTRKKLYNELYSTYDFLNQYNLQQLHFHLSNNTSFLRFHRPLKFGDDLSDIRRTIAYTNSTKEPIDGFEEGRIFNGYRFVFPLKKNEKHLGSAEVSFSTTAFNKAYFEDYRTPIIFLISKNIVDTKLFQEEKSNYKPSFIKNFYIQTKENMPYDNFKISKQTIQKIFDGKPFSLYSDTLKKVITFIPVINPISQKVVATHLVYQKDLYIQNKILNFYIVTLLFLSFLTITLFYIYKNNEKKEQLKTLNEDLETKIKEAVDNLKRKDEMLLKQSKSAAMGEMVDAIAHQWKSPLGLIRLYAQEVLYNLEQKVLNKEMMQVDLEKLLLQTSHLLDTIDSFREFFKPTSVINAISLKQIIQECIILMKDELVKNTIEVRFDGEDKEILILKNEFKHILINLFSNSKDAFNLNNIKQGKITISAKQISDFETKIYIQDNAGGIPLDVIENIFKPHFTTKSNIGGTGIGLYLCKQILEKIGSDIIVYNKNNGACFEITLIRACEERRLKKR